MRARALLLALDHEAETAGQLTGRVAQRLGGLDPMEQLALVVAHAPGEEPLVPNHRVVGRRLPQVERRGGLDVVVLDADQGARPGPHFAHHQRRDTLFAKDRDLGPGGSQALLDPLGAAVQLGELIGLTGDGAEVAKLLDPAVEALVAEGIEGIEVSRHGPNGSGR